MTENATPKRPSYSRPTKYPAALPRTMVTQEIRDAADGLVAARGDGLGAITRALVADGLVLDAAYNREPGLREDVERMARDAGVETPEAVATMLGFAVRESRRRTARNAELARGVAVAFAEVTGIAPDGVSVGNVDLSLDG